MHLTHFVQLSETVTEQPLCEGNSIEPLWVGDQAYPAMLQAIEDARHSVGLSICIFNNDRAGNDFAEALGRCARELGRQVSMIRTQTTIDNGFGIRATPSSTPAGPRS